MDHQSTQNLLNYIALLTSRDTKSLTQKNLKLSEEVGELSAKVLPFEGAAGTQHRVPSSIGLLEECADVFLVNQSIVFSLGFTMDEFWEMVFKKAQVWNGLQVQESRAYAKSATLPFEIHITVRCQDGIDIDQFKADCAKIGVKPILLALQDVAGNKIMDDAMTSSTLLGHNGDAMSEMERISKALISLGYTIERQKIESSYWHPKAPFDGDTATKMPEGCYFECHLNTLCNDALLPVISGIASGYGAHLSKNAFKVFEDGQYTLMLTLRSYDGVYEAFNQTLKTLKSVLAAASIMVEKEIVEFAVFDSKVSHDQRWLEETNA